MYVHVEQKTYPTLFYRMYRLSPLSITSGYGYIMFIKFVITRKK